VSSELNDSGTDETSDSVCFVPVTELWWVVN
jgi:hypothetical protein